MQPITGPEKQNEDIFTGVEPSTLSWTYYESQIRMKSMIYCTFMLISEIKNIKLYPLALITQQGLKNEVSIHPGQVEFAAGLVTFHSYLPEGERDRASYLPTISKLKKLKQELPRASKSSGLLGQRANQNSCFFLSLPQIKNFFLHFVSY